MTAARMKELIAWQLSDVSTVRTICAMAVT